MIDALFNQPNLVAAKRLMDVTVLRHEAIATNLANVETPGYRRMDVGPAFEQQLQKAVAARDVASMKSIRPQLAVDATAVSRRRDGNTVDLESEMVRLNRNSIEYGVEAHFITSALLKMRHAITGRSA
ncbi:MAG: flagellar basal body rod protein FlgB [Verrucomicrobiae bacterium]|nr:flagellar basal body rod protein FlgB [Verrucomicrobiae bacterium]